MKLLEILKNLQKASYYTKQSLLINNTIVNELKKKKSDYIKLNFIHVNELFAKNDIKMSA